jgi:hypothetical protein
MLNYFTSKNKFTLYFLALSSLFLNSIAFVTIPKFINEKITLNNPNVNYGSTLEIIETFIDGIILAPLLETLIFQHLIFKLSRFIIKNNKLSLILFLTVSSLSFGLSHFSSLVYIVYTVFIGFIFAFFYEVFYLKRSKPYWNVVFLHAMFNFILFLISIVLILLGIE